MIKSLALGLSLLTASTSVWSLGLPDLGPDYEAEYVEIRAAFDEQVKYLQEHYRAIKVDNSNSMRYTEVVQTVEPSNHSIGCIKEEYQGRMVTACSPE